MFVLVYDKERFDKSEKGKRFDIKIEAKDLHLFNH